MFSAVAVLFISFCTAVPFAFNETSNFASGANSLALHLIDSPPTHCHELQVTDNTTDCWTSYWGAHGYQFANYKESLCPTEYNIVTEHNTICPGADARIKGINGPTPPSPPSPTPTPPSPSPPQPAGCKKLGDSCSGSKSAPQGTCCNNMFCKYWQPAPGNLCVGCYNCKCEDGSGPGNTDDPQKCVDASGKICPSVKEC